MVADGHTIGEVLNRLKHEFDDVSISKIRFLESEGLVRPGRSESGYRQFSDADVERLRYVLLAQRDRYLPLKVIKEELSRIDAGLPVEVEPLTLAEQPTLSLAHADGRAGAEMLGDVALDRTELLHVSGLTEAELAGLITNGILEDAVSFDGAALRVTRTAAELLRRGLEPRHLRGYRLAAEREADRIEQLVAPLLRQRNPESRREASTRAEELVALGAQLHRLLLEDGLTRVLGP